MHGFISEIDVVRQQLVAAQQASNTATENAKVSVGVVSAAFATMEKAMAAVNSANASAIAATQAAKLAQGNLESARAEFAKLVERVRG